MGIACFKEINSFGLENVCTVEVEGGTGSMEERREPNAISGPF